MSTWGQILKELAAGQAQGQPPDFDGVRRKYLAELYEYTGRDVILYASGWIQNPEASPESVSIGDEDIQALMEVNHGLEGDKLDLILHSPGGSPEAAEAIVSYLRSHFSHIRVIVPTFAMSAATMITCAADQVILGTHSFLGPTDPQILLPTPLGARMAPAQEILDQFDMVRRMCTDSEESSAWTPMLEQYGPELLVQCESALSMSKTLVKRWLETWMFKGMNDRSKKARAISEWFADHKHFMSHSRHIPRAEIEAKQLKVIRLEEDHILEDLSLSIFHAATHVFARSPVRKIIENHIGDAFIK